MMLQQTTVKAVVPFFNRFVTRFPNVQSLADADFDEVLPFWAGLGYYSRARLLHRCAQEIVAKHNGVFPQELHRVLELPGVGRYTAGAVTSIAFNEKNPIVDANVARVFSRIFLIDGDLKNAANQTILWKNATQVVGNCGKFAPSIVNPSMMELGALLCTPKNPQCEICPVQIFCGAFKQNRQHELPFIAAKRGNVELQDVCAYVARTSSTGNAEILLRQRSHEPGIWWRGLWELPRTTRHQNENAHDALRRLFRDELHIDEMEVGDLLKTVSHGVTHHKITLECWHASLETIPETSPAQWFEADEIAHLALPSTMKFLIAWLLKNAEIGQGRLF